MQGAESLAQCLRWARAEQGITLQEVSERSGRAVSYISQLEHGVKLNPTKQTVEALAEALGVRPAFLFGEVPRPPYTVHSLQAVTARAGGLSERFCRFWASLPGQGRLDYLLSGPERRFCLVVEFLIRQGCSVVEVAWQLGMSTAELRDILARSREVSFTFLEQLARITGVPLHFLTHGEMEPAAPPRPGESLRYVRAIRLAMERRVSPERLESLIRSLSSG